MKVSRSWVTILSIAILTVIIITGLQIFFNINSKVVEVKDVQSIEPNLDLTIVSKMTQHKALLVHTY